MAWQGYSAMFNLQTHQALQHCWGWCKRAFRITSNPPSPRCLTYWGSTWGLWWSRSRRGSQWGWGHTSRLPVLCPHAACACPRRQKGLWVSAHQGPKLHLPTDLATELENTWMEIGPEYPTKAQEYLAAGIQVTDVHWGRRRVFRLQTSGLSKSLCLDFSMHNLASLILPWHFWKRPFCQS